MKELLINSLGGYEPKVCVSTFGRETWRGENGYYAAHTVANNLPDMKWEIDGDIKNVAEKIVKELEESCQEEKERGSRNCESKRTSRTKYRGKTKNR